MNPTLIKLMFMKKYQLLLSTLRYVVFMVVFCSTTINIGIECNLRKVRRTAVCPMCKVFYISKEWNNTKKSFVPLF